MKILLYSDLRVLPDKIGTLEERLSEVLQRRKDLRDRPDIKLICDASRQIEKQIQENIDVSVGEINVQNIMDNTENFLNIEI